MALIAVGTVSAVGSTPPVDSGTDRADVPTESVEPRLLRTLHGPTPIIVQFDESVPADLAIEHPSVSVRYTFEALPAVFAWAPPDAVRDLAHDDDVHYVERADKPIAFDLDTSTNAINADAVWAPSQRPDLPELTTEGGETVDGSGVGIAIVDTGVDRTHPDFQDTGKVAASYLATPNGVEEAPYHSPLAPHGTVTAGIAAGTGDASGGTYRGVAPNASVYSFAVKHAKGLIGNPEDTYVLYPAIAMDWILAHGDEQDPPIRVVNNAWHCTQTVCQTFEEERAHNRLASQLARSGVVVTFSAGNFETKRQGGGIVPEATNPTPGVLGVTSYNDQNLGIRTACTAGFSSDGNPGDPTTWPDVAAPGVEIASTWAMHLSTQTRIGSAQSVYEELTGTSLAAAHVSGVAALVLEANPKLSAGEIEFLLEDTATPLREDFCGTDYFVADPTNPFSPANYRAGHGLVDAHAAVNTSLGFPGIPDDEPATEEVPRSAWPGETAADIDTGVDVNQHFYLTGEDELTQTRPTDDQARTRFAGPNEPQTFTSPPLADGFTATGFDGSVHVSMFGGGQDPGTYTFFSPLEVQVEVQRIAPDGSVLQAATGSVAYDLQVVPEPKEYPVVTPLDRELAFQAGDRVRVNVTVTDPGLAPVNRGITHWQLAWGAALAPSHVGLGDAVFPTEPGSQQECRLLPMVFCAWMDIDHPDPGFECEGGALYRLTWTGPPGSSARISCDAAVAECEIPQDVEAEMATCTEITQYAGRTATSGGPATCSFESPDDAGYGKCEIVADT